MTSLMFVHIYPPANEVWGQVIFSEACVKNSVHRVGVVSQHALQVVSQHALQVSGGGGIPACTEVNPPARGQLLPRAVRILLECILVLGKF